MNRDPVDWHRHFLGIAELASLMSKDPSTKVGCVLVKDRRVVGTGFNGFPKGIRDDGRLEDREKKYALVVHAEMNAILDAGREAEGSTLYLYGFTGCPCQNCTKHAIAAGVNRVIAADVGECPERWKPELDAAEKTWKEVADRDWETV